jgi:hypothetical protein
MIEKIVQDYLTEKLSVQVLTEEPDKPPKSYVLIEKTGSGRKNFIENATLAIKSYDTSMYKTAVLNEMVKKAMEDIIEIDAVSRCELNTDYNYTDTETKRYRYQAVFDIVYHR